MDFSMSSAFINIPSIHKILLRYDLKKEEEEEL